MKYPDPDPDSAVCTRTLGKLCDEVGPESVDEFIGMFKSLWPSRLARLHEALAANDKASGEDAALSVKSAATMAGAHKLAGLALQLQYAFRDDDAGTLGELMRRIEHAGNVLLAILQSPGFTERALQAYRGSVSA